MIELRPNLPRVEFGVLISRQGGARRRRAGLHALRKLIDWLIAQPSIFRIEACCTVDGVAHRAMERLGFTLEGKLVNYGCLPNLGLAAPDAYLYALTRPVPPKTVHPAAAWLTEHAVW
jgi:RimJ/RimL family protein N-acetyltransferase